MKQINPLNQISSGYQASIICLVAVKEGLFSVIGSEKLDAPCIAKKLNWNSSKAERFCNALVVNKLLRKEKNKYCNTAISKRFLVKGKPEYQGNILEHHWHLLNRWLRLGEVLSKSFRPPETRPKLSKKELEAFILGMKNRASEGAREFLKAIDLSWARNMLDLGGGPATFSIKFTEKHKKLNATVFDLPEVITITKSEINKAHTKKVKARRGDILKGNYGKNYDLIFISNIIHSFNLDTNKKMFRYSIDSLAPEGKIMIKDFYVNENRDGPYFPVMFSINMMMGPPGGDTYTLKEIKHLLQQVGFRKIKTVDVGQDSKVIIGEKL